MRNLGKLNFSSQVTVKYTSMTLVSEALQPNQHYNYLVLNLGFIGNLPSKSYHETTNNKMVISLENFFKKHVKV